MRNRIAIISIAALMSGCAGTTYGYLIDTYHSVQATAVNTPNGTFQVWDRPDLGKILTSPPAANVIVPGLVQGATFGAVDILPLTSAHQAAALQWLASNGRTCTISTSSEIAKPEFEHTYTCK